MVENNSQPGMSKKICHGWFLPPVLILTSFFLTVIFLEILARLFLPVPPRLVIENLNKPGQSDYTEYGDFHVDQDGHIESERLPGGFFLYSHTGTRLKRNARGVVRNHAVSNTDVDISTNSLGFRHRELGPKKKNELRILVLGDSITFGDFVPQDQTYPAYLERHLRAMFPAKHIEVINAGVGGVDLQNEFAILMESGLSVEPDIVLVGLYLNDAHESPFLKISRLPSWLDWSHLARFVLGKVDKLRALYREHKWEEQSPEAWKEARARFARQNPLREGGGNTDASLNWEIHHAFRDWGYAWDDGYWDKVLDIIDMMADVSQDHHFKLAFCYFPVRFQITAAHLKNEPQQRFEMEMQRRRLPHLDLLPVLRSKYSGDQQDLLYDHCHYRPEGNAFIGEMLARFMADHLL